MAPFLAALKKNNRLILAGLLGAITIALFFLIAFQLTSGEPLFDFTAFWIAGKLTLDGADPYSKDDWIPVYEPYDLGLKDNQTFLYPKPILPLFLPFGLLPLRAASVIWLVLTQSTILVSILLLAKAWPGNPLPYILPFYLGILIFRSYLVTLTLGQLGGIFVLTLTVVLLRWQKSDWFWGGVIFSFLALKPSLGFPLIFLVSLWFLKNRVWRYFLGLATGGALMLVTGWLFDPQWIGKYLEIGSGKVAQTFGYHPTLWGLSGFLCGGQAACTYLLGSIIAGALFLLFFWFLTQKSFAVNHEIVLHIAILVTLLITPYLWVYDQILLVIPLAFVVGKTIQRGSSYMTVASLPILVSVVSLLMLPVAVRLRNDVLNVVVPLLVLMLFLGLVMKRNKIESKSPKKEY